ncbi:MAG: hypothetical protein JSS27_17215 [Planctomycetes bacterium]|nr:hypothetical protein [Planctomycetota bacterium]
MRMAAACWLILAFCGIAAWGATAWAEERPAGIPENYQLVYSQDFKSADAVGDFQMTDAAAWKHALEDNRGALELFKQSKYKPPYRSPVNIALVRDLRVGDVVIEADCLQTGKEYGHRDMVIFFGFQSPSQYYYTHIATKADDHANNIFIVNDAARLKISKVSNEGNNWGLNVWHRVRVHRQVSDGSIRVYFDDLTKPIMVAEDKTFGTGWLGFGSFDDTGKVSNIRVWSPSAEKKAAPAFAN